MYDPLKAKARVVLFAGSAAVVGLGVASGLGWTSTSHAMPPVVEEPQVPEEAVRPAMDLSEAFTNLADAVTPAVVRIETRRTVTRRSSSRDVPEQFRRFFDQQPEGGTPGAAGHLRREWVHRLP